MNEVFKALADPTRRRVLRMLAGGERTAGDIAREFDISGPSMSHHFAVLKAADLITGRREGQQIVYSLNTTVVQDAMTLILDLFGPMPERAENGETA
jgi:DNA-binding transcriptional ArsR family regulator